MSEFHAAAMRTNANIRAVELLHKTTPVAKRVRWYTKAHRDKRVTKQ